MVQFPVGAQNKGNIGMKKTKMTYKSFNDLSSEEKDKFLLGFDSEQLTYIQSILDYAKEMQQTNIDTLRRYGEAVRALTAIDILTNEEAPFDMKGKLENVHRFAQAAVLMEKDKDYKVWKKRIEHILSCVDKDGKFHWKPNE